MIFFKHEINPDNTDEILFEASENNMCLGQCVLCFENNYAVIKSISFEVEKFYIADGLVKSAFNYAAAKNYYMGYCRCENIGGFLDKMNFEVDNGIYFNDIPSILQGNCCKKY